MLSAETQILNLLGRYAECIDSGDLQGASQLFAHATIKTQASPGDVGNLDAAGVLEVWRAFIVIYDDGTPRTKHVITNPIIDVDMSAGVASCRSYYTVFQQTDGFPLQPIVVGRYHDRFELVGDTWRFSFRDYSLVDMFGDMSHHAKTPIP